MHTVAKNAETTEVDELAEKLAEHPEVWVAANRSGQLTAEWISAEEKEGRLAEARKAEAEAALSDRMFEYLMTLPDVEFGKWHGMYIRRTSRQKGPHAVTLWSPEVEVRTDLSTLMHAVENQLGADGLVSLIMARKVAS